MAKHAMIKQMITLISQMTLVFNLSLLLLHNLKSNLMSVLYIKEQHRSMPHIFLKETLKIKKKNFPL